MYKQRQQSEESKNQREDDENSDKNNSSGSVPNHIFLEDDAMEREVNMAIEDENISPEEFEDIENVILVDVTEKYS
eukprot:11480538-Ditylum_brightwellii.AAC.1